MSDAALTVNIKGEISWHEACYKIIETTMRGETMSATDFQALRREVVDGSALQLIDVVYAIEAWKKEH